MTTTLTQPSLTDFITTRVHESAERLRRDPFYARIIGGTATREEYAAWLVQKHKYVRYTEELIKHLVAVSAGPAEAGGEAAALHEYAQFEAVEEANHDDLLVKDLAALWDVSRAEARGRIELSERAPSILTYARIYEAFLVHQPKSILGIAFALESLAALHADEIRLALLAKSRIEGIQRSVQFLAAHCAEVEDDHRSHAAARIEGLSDATEQAAVHHLASLALDMYEGLAFYLGRKFPAQAS